MGTSLFGALGQLGEQFGTARTELNEENRRTSLLALQMQRQKALDQIAQQRLGMEQQRLGFEQQRVGLEGQRAQAEEKARQDNLELQRQKGWEKPLIFKSGDRKFAMNPLTGETRDALPGQLTFEEEEAIKKAKPQEFELKPTGTKGEYTYFPKTPGEGKITPTGLYQPPKKGAGTGTNLFGDTPQQIAQDAADMIMKGVPFQQATTNLGKGGKGLTMRELQKRGWIPPLANTLQNKNILSSIDQFDQATLNRLDQVLQQTDPATGKPLKDSNTFRMSLRQRWQWMQYQTLGKDPDDPLLSAITGYASFAKIAGTTPWARTGRGVKILEIIAQHLPNPEKDTPQNMYAKLQRLRQQLGTQKQILSLETYGGRRDPASGKIIPIEPDIQNIQGIGDQGLPDPNAVFQPQEEQ